MLPVFVISATLLVSAFSLIGALGVSWLTKRFPHFILGLVSLSAGSLLGAAFFHLLPEGIEELGVETTFLVTVGSYCLFLLMEKILPWQHCHTEDCPVHTFAYLNLVGDSVHNFIDGLVMAAAFQTNVGLGVATTLAVMLHELPQEWGDMGVLLHAGMPRRRALMANVAVSLTAVLGGVLGLALGMFDAGLTPYLLPIAAGGFFYIASSDLVPELRQSKSRLQDWLIWLALVVGVLVMVFTARLE